MTADMADVSQRVKMLVVKAEDARILGDMEVGPHTKCLAHQSAIVIPSVAAR
jgi:hypothetical protein